MKLITFAVLLWSREAMNWQGWNEVDQVLDGVKIQGTKEVAIVVNTNYDYQGIQAQSYVKNVTGTRSKSGTLQNR